MFFGEYAAQSDKVVSVGEPQQPRMRHRRSRVHDRSGTQCRSRSYGELRPLFAKGGWQWRPNLIWVDNLRSYGTPNYYAKLFANNRGDAVLPVKLDAASGKKLFASATHDDATGEVILKIVNGDKDAAEVG